MLDLHRFMIAVARVSVNHDGKGGTALDPLVWDQGSRLKARKLAIRVNVDLASLPGPPGFLDGPWVHFNGGHISGSDIAAWPYCVGILIRFTSFLSALHWPSCSDDFRYFGVSFVELLILLELRAGHRLLSEKVNWPHVRENRPTLIPSAPVSEGIEIRHDCQFISSLVGALTQLPGGLGRFNAMLYYLSHVQVKASWVESVFSWLTSGPLESCHHQCLEAVCDVLGYPRGSALELLDGTLKLRHCTTLFPCVFPNGLYLGLEMEW